MSQPSIDALRNLHDGQVALVLGNSSWRAGFPIDQWRSGPIIACNFAYREFSRPAFVCAEDVETIYEIVRDESFDHTLITPTSLGKKRFVEAIAANGVQTIPVEGAFKTEPMSGAMAIALAGWLGCRAAVLVGFSCDTTTLKSGESRPGSLSAAVQALEVGVSEMRRLSPGSHITLGVEPSWFAGILQEQT